MSDPNLKKKSYYTALSTLLSVIVGFSVQLLLTPFLVQGLGQRGYAIYAIINRLQGYLSIADFRPTAILRYKLSVLQSSSDQELKRRLVGASLVVGLASILPMMFIGYLMGITADDVFNLVEAEANEMLLAILLASVFMGLKPILGIPDAIIRGNNLAYLAFYVDPFRAVLYFLFALFALKKDWGVVGVIFAIVCAGIIDAVLRLLVVVKSLPGYHPSRPPRNIIKDFFNKGGWYLGSSVIFQLLNSFDVFLVGYLYGLEMVAAYTITKAMMFRVSESVGNIMMSISASIGHIMGDQGFARAAQVRKYIHRYSIMIGAFIASYFILFNHAFVALWVGSDNYSGDSVNLMLALAAMLILPITGEEIFINLSQQYSRKTGILTLSLLISLTVLMLMNPIVGVASVGASIFFGKLTQLVMYWKQNNHVAPMDVKGFCKQNIRLLVIVVPVIIFCGLEIPDKATTWIRFAIASVGYLVLFGVIVAIFVLNRVDYRLISDTVFRRGGL